MDRTSILIFLTLALWFVSGFLWGAMHSDSKWYAKWEQYCAPYDGIETGCTKVYTTDLFGG